MLLSEISRSQGGKDGGSKFLRNFGVYLYTYTVSQPKRK
jgi:hypothetical protein